MGRLSESGYEPLLTLPSGGDTSYPGLVWHDGLLWVSYYSSHEGKAAIYPCEDQTAMRQGLGICNKGVSR